MMPGIGGNEALKQLIEFDPKVLVIVASGYAINGPVQDAFAAGAKDYIGKPYDYESMMTKINHVWKNRS